MSYTIGSLFAGGGGIDLGFEWAGFHIVWQVELNDYCRMVLAKRFPHAERFDDVRNCGQANLSAVDVIVGGFPCQDISNAGKRAGITGERSGLWREYARIIGELRPKFVFVENVAALLGRGIDVVLGDLSALGYDAEWRIVSAADMGAPHLRERVWVVAYTRGIRYIGPSAPYAAALDEERNRSPYRIIGRTVANSIVSGSEDVADTNSNQATRQREHRGEINSFSETNGPCSGGLLIPHSDSERLSVRYETGDGSEAMERVSARGQFERIPATPRFEQWAIEPDVGRVANGISKRVDRLKLLGNAVVPQIPELFAHRIRKALDNAVQEETQ